MLTALERLREDLKEQLASGPFDNHESDAYDKGGIAVLREIIEFNFENYVEIMGEDSDG